MTTDTADRPGYEADYYLWALDQAARLRAMASLRPNEPLDWELLAEEVEGLARSDLRACRSYVELIIVHLLKLVFSSLDDPRGHWTGEIANFRSELSLTLTPSLERSLRESQELEVRYRQARKRAIASLSRDEPGFADRLPETCPWTWEQITGDWWPESLAFPGTSS